MAKRNRATIARDKDSYAIIAEALKTPGKVFEIKGERLELYYVRNAVEAAGMQGSFEWRLPRYSGGKYFMVSWVNPDQYPDYPTITLIYVPHGWRSVTTTKPSVTSIE